MRIRQIDQVDSKPHGGNAVDSLNASQDVDEFSSLERGPRNGGTHALDRAQQRAQMRELSDGTPHPVVFDRFERCFEIRERQDPLVRSGHRLVDPKLRGSKD